MVALLVCLAMSACTTVGDGPGAELSGDRSDAASYNWPLVRVGDLDRTVVAVQYLLRHHGEDVSLTGLFDEVTEDAVISFQSKNGLLADGIVGSNTWQALIVMVRRGDEGNAVRAVQDLLLERYGYGISVTGLFGPTTEERVLQFQEDRCLSYVDAIVGPETWYTLVSEVNMCSGGGGSASAQRVLSAHNQGQIELWDQTFGRYDGADPLSNITDAANGRAAKTSCYGNAPCTQVQLGDKMLVGMESIIYNYGYSYFVTAIAGANHGPNSYHFAGRAVDFGIINGEVIRGDSAQSRALMEACRQTGAIEVLGPSNDANHYDHVHCAW